MKRYLWTAVAVLFVNANASENPFELKENLTQINNDEDALLSELSALAEAREDAELEDDDMDAELEKEANVKEAPKKKKAESKGPVVVDAALDAEDAEMDAELAAEAKKHGLPLGELKKEANSKEAAVKTKDSEEQYDVANAIDALVGDTAEEAPVIADQAANDAVKAAQEKADEEKSKQAIVKKEADAREEERREVEAYEKQRAEKLAKEAEAAAQKEAEQKSEAAYSVKMWKAEQETVEKTAVETTVVKEVITEKIEIVDEKSVETPVLADGEIDVKAEKRAAKEAADAAYLEAVREMDKED